MSNGPAEPRTLRMIRLALLTGVLLLGAVAWYVTRPPAEPRIDPAASAPLAVAFAGLALVTLVGLALVRSLQSAATDRSRQTTLTVAGWALGEAPALLGGVLYLLTSGPLPYLAGLVLQLTAFVLIPIPEPR